MMKDDYLQFCEETKKKKIVNEGVLLNSLKEDPFESNHVYL